VSERGRAVVIGVGNPYRLDDGIGPAVLDLLSAAEADLAGVVLAESDGEVSQLLELWTGADLAVVIDAVRVHDPHPGRIHCRELSDLRPPGAVTTTSHAADLGEAVALARVLDRLPAALVFYAVEVEDTGFGCGLTPPVRSAAETLASLIASLLTTRRESDVGPLRSD
jgi:hydrogenase maturation protease